tara:strand:+ start:1858 stop:2046 length:189 start_codon:yes stop_codon:yes gene_type:complete
MLCNTDTFLIKITRKITEYYQTRRLGADMRGNAILERIDGLRETFWEFFYLGYDLEVGVNDE